MSADRASGGTFGPNRRLDGFRVSGGCGGAASHAAAQWLARDRWKIRYLRAAVDVALAGLLVLFVATCLPEHRNFGHLPGAMKEKLLGMRGLWMIAGTWNARSLTEALGKLETLSNISWFLDNFPLYVALPASVVLLSGYGLERSKQA